MKYRTILVIALFLVGCNKGQKIESESLPTVERFFSQMGNHDYASALNDLIASNPNILPSDSDAVDLKKKFATINQYSGVYRGNSLLSKKIDNDDLAAYSYLVKYDKKFYRFLFVFYNNGLVTKLYKFSFDDDADSELEESIKLYF